MERKGRHFEFGYPHFFDGVSYNWPDESRDYNALFSAKIDELEPVLLDKLRKYIQDFDIFTSTPHYPHAFQGRKGLQLNVGDGGRWIEAWNTLGGYFVNQHNLDSWKERAACFNIGADILEFLDETILAPRVNGQNENYVLRYPIPKSRGLIISQYFNEPIIEQTCKIAGLEGKINIIVGDDIQRIETPHGQIVIQDNICEGRGFKSWNVAKASWVVASVMSLYGSD